MGAKTGRMVEAELVAYPLLLAASYGVYRLGRRHPGRVISAFDLTRVGFQAAILGLVAAVSIRLVAAGALPMPYGPLAPALSLPGIAGLIVMDAAHLLRRELPTGAGNGESNGETGP